MKKYSYVAVNLNRKQFTGSFLAENEDDLRRKLAQQGLYLVSAKTVSEKSPKASFFSVRSRVSLSELTTFCRQFSIMINVGISVVDSLNMLQQQKFSGLMKKTLYLLTEDVQSGLMLSEAMGKHKKIFPQFFQSMVLVGEQSGSLDTVLVNVADYYEKTETLRKKIKSAMAYPALLMLLTVGLIGLMVGYVIPTFKRALATMDLEMPALTMAIFNLSDFVIKNWRNMATGVIFAVALFIGIGKMKWGRYFYDTVLVKVPPFRKFTSYNIAAKFSRTFGLLLYSGMDIVASLDLSSGLLGNKNVEKRFRLAVTDIKQGMNMTMAFEAYHLFPQLLMQMISVGEKTGAMDEVLMNSCKHFDELTENALQAIVGLIQPVLLIFMGGAVGVMFMAVYSPIITIMKGFMQ